MHNQSRLLIVDDEEGGREALDLLLSAEGYDLHFAENGHQALEQARTLCPDLILLDVMMPGMDGFEVCRYIRRDPELAEVPVILLTALDDKESRLRGLQAGADDYISKPFDRLELRARIRTITRLNRYRRLLAERGKFKWVVEESDDGYVLLDSEGQITYANPRARFLLHLPAKEENSPDAPPHYFLGQAQRYYHLDPPETWQQWSGNSNPPPSGYMVRPETAETRALWLQIDGFPLNSQGDEGLLLRMRDVTTQMNLQQQAWTFQRLVSHKLRTPLMGLTVLSMLKRQIHSLLDAKTAQLFEMAEYNVDRVYHQIMDILRYVDAPSLLQIGARVNAESLHAQVRELARELELEVELTIPDEFAHTLALSEEALKCVLEELFSNAKKFHPDQTPTVSLEVRPPENGRVRIWVRDNGRYLSPEELRNVWLPYYQVEKKFTGEVKGMGLGLSTVASLMWRVGGSCHIRNRTQKQGVAVELEIPLYVSPTH